MIVKLGTPIQSPKGELHELTLRRLKAKDYLAVEKQGLTGDIEIAVALLGRACGLNSMLLEELDAEDFQAAQEALKKPRGPVPGTGE